MTSNAPSQLATQPKHPPSQLHNSQQSPPTSQLQPQQPPPPPPKAHSTKSPPRLSPRVEFWLEWILKSLGVAAAIVFGIWAPISYQATVDGNAGNNASQESIASRLSALHAQATSAASFQRSAASAIAELNSKVDGIGLLWAYSYCDGRDSSLSACGDLSSKVDIGDVITSVADLPSSDESSSLGSPSSSPSSTDGTTIATSTVGYTPTSTMPSKNTGRVSVTLAMALGIVFGVLVLAGLIVGILVSMKKRVQKRTSEGAYPAEWRSPGNRGD